MVHDSSVIEACGCIGFCIDACTDHYIPAGHMMLIVAKTEDVCVQKEALPEDK